MRCTSFFIYPAGEFWQARPDQLCRVCWALRNEVHRNHVHESILMGYSPRLAVPILSQTLRLHTRFLRPLCVFRIGFSLLYMALQKPPVFPARLSYENSCVSPSLHGSNPRAGYSIAVHMF